MKLLVVDDDPVTLRLLQTTLLRSGHQPEIARNGREALEKLTTGEFRLVISDWDMPEMDGVELVRQIRATEFGGYVFVILLTARDHADDATRGLDTGADEYLTKPFNPSEMAARVRTGERILAMETRDLAIFAMAKLAESRDPETGKHLDRVRGYCKVLADHLLNHSEYKHEMTGNFSRLIYLTSPLHDIGKVAIPDRVLLKPGRLDADEFEIMKTHTIRGAETLQAALNEHPGATFLKMAAEIAASHHERYDGSGYPYKLKGLSIPLSGRIVALADVYDALSSKRVYKDAFVHDVARSIIVSEKGTHFDPIVVEGFLKVEQQFQSIRKLFAEEHQLQRAA